VTLNVYNLLNTNSPLGIQGRSGPQFGFVTSIPPGRLVEGAFRLGFQDLGLANDRGASASVVRDRQRPIS
jgi:hypothetical protein